MPKKPSAKRLRFMGIETPDGRRVPLGHDLGAIPVGAELIELGRFGEGDADAGTGAGETVLVAYETSGPIVAGEGAIDHGTITRHLSLPVELVTDATEEV